MRGLPQYEFVARSAIAAIECRLSPTSGAKLMETLRGAKALGYSLYAR
jgi:hypothetical protein